MDQYINKVELQGNIGSIRTNKLSNSTVTNFTLATNYAYKDREGAAVIETTWHNCVAFEGPAIQNLDKLAKGTPVHITGRLRTNKYTDNNGVERSYSEVFVKTLEIL